MQRWARREQETLAEQGWRARIELWVFPLSRHGHGATLGSNPRRSAEAGARPVLASRGFAGGQPEPVGPSETPCGAERMESVSRGSYEAD